MAKILCAISGIEFSCEHVPMVLHSREAKHPIFHLPQKKLLGLYGKWVQSELTDTDNYLLYTALLNSSGLVHWTVPAIRTPDTRAVIANNMQRLVEVVTKITATPQPANIFASIQITAENKDLAPSHIWIEIWEANYRNWMDGYKHELIQRSIRQREEVLQKLIKDSTKTPENYARLLSNWANEAGKFPDFTVDSPITGEKQPLSAYWMQIIQMCVREERIFMVPRADLEELIEHCEEHIDQGSIYAHSLMRLLKSGLAKQKNYLGLGDIDITASTYRIISNDTTVEDANKMAMIDSAPREKPQLHNYPTKLAYLRAKAKWDMAQTYEQMQNLNNKEKE